MTKAMKSKVDTMKNYVVDDLVNIYHCNKDDAVNMVKNSAFGKMVTKEPKFIFHYSVDYWARDVLHEYSIAV